MTRDQFIAREKHQILGLVIDAMVVRRNGADLSIFMETVTGRVEEVLGRVYDQVNPKPLPVKPAEPTKPPANGVHTGPLQQPQRR